MAGLIRRAAAVTVTGRQVVAERPFGHRFRDVAVHVVQAEGVGLRSIGVRFARHRDRIATTGAGMVKLLMAQVLLSFVCDGEGPVRFGFPLPADQLARGLRAEPAPAALQWRRLQDRADTETGRVWVELAVAGVSGRVRVRAGGDGPAPPSGGPVVYFDEGKHEDRAASATTQRWRWCTGEVDERVRTVFLEPATVDDEVFEPGECLTRETAGFAQRATRVRIEPRDWRRAGVLPAAGPLARRHRELLVSAAKALRCLPGLRGAGDYGRSNDVVTNLEFDTTLGFARLGMAMAEPELLLRALGAARHLVDRDLDPRTGLPFGHGDDHRRILPEPGHAWLTGLLWAGCFAADRQLIAAARTMAESLARYPSFGRGRDDRMRDRGWPLLELENWLRFAGDVGIERAADEFVDDLVARWDPQAEVVRFGEGETDGRSYHERAWLTAGILVPALRAHLRRRQHRPARAILTALEQRLAALVMAGAPGLPVHYWVRDGAVGGQSRQQTVPEVFMVLEGVPTNELARCLRRSTIQKALDGVPDLEHPDLATHFSIAARCEWVLR